MTLNLASVFAPVACACALAAGCGGDFSLPSARPRGPVSGSVLSTRNVAVSWTRSDPGRAALCLDVCAARSCVARRTATLPIDVTEYVIPIAMLPEGPAAFWRVRDCEGGDDAARAPVWQFFVPRVSTSTARANVEAMGTDLDGDALPDLVYQGAWVGPRGRVERRRGGTGWAGSVLSIAPPVGARAETLRFTVAGDLDGNGFTDMLVLGRTVEVLLGGLGPELDDLLPTGFAVPPGAEVAGGRDLDGDGRGDVLVASPGALRVCSLDAGAALRCEVTTAPGAGASRVRVRTLADLDGDGAPEVILATAGGVDAGAIWTRWSITSQWRREGAGFDGGVVSSLGDLDGDGHPEIAWTSRASTLAIGSWRDGVVDVRALEVPCDAGGAVASVVAADFDGDGTRELAATCTRADGPTRLFVFAGDTAREVSLAAGELGAGALLAADDDGDGVSDLFVHTAAGALARLSLPRATTAEPAAASRESTPEGARAPVRPARVDLDVLLAEGSSAEGGTSWTLGHDDFL